MTLKTFSKMYLGLFGIIFNAHLCIIHIIYIKVKNDSNSTSQIPENKHDLVIR